MLYRVHVHDLYHGMNYGTVCMYASLMYVRTDGTNHQPPASQLIYMFPAVPRSNNCSMIMKLKTVVYVYGVVKMSTNWTAALVRFTCCIYEY